MNLVLRRSRTSCRKYSHQSSTKTFDEIPGPSRFSIVRGFMPTGEFYGKTIVNYFKICREKYGDIFILPGVFGRRDLLLTFNPADFETVFRTHGMWPMRRGLDLIEYHRKVKRANFFMERGGLVAE